MARLLDLDVEMLGDRPAVRQLGLVADRVGDLRPAWDAIHDGAASDPLLRGGGTSFTAMVRAHFASLGARGPGGRWPGYDDEPVYRRIKIRFGGGLQNMLRWVRGRERLWPSLVERGHPEHVYDARALSVAMGTRVPHARSHQEGSGLQPFDKVPLKRRRPIDPTEADFRGWTRAIQRHVMWPLSPQGRIAARGPAGRAGAGA